MCYHRIRLLSLLVTAISLVSSLAACGDGAAESYKKFDVVNGLFQFSFEYPDNYETPTISHIHYGTSVHIYHYPDDSDVFNIVIFITAQEIKSLIPVYPQLPTDAHSELEKDIRDGELGIDAIVINQITTQLFEKPVDQITYKKTTDSSEYDNWKPVNRLISRRVYFDYGDSVWIAGVKTTESLQDEAFSTFDQILSTLNIYHR